MRNLASQRVAIVAPFFGRDFGGRKERFAFAFATHLAIEGMAIEVMTTTATPDAADANFFVAGTDVTEPFPVHRFRVEAPDRAAYEGAVLAAGGRHDVPHSREAALLDERLRSPELLAHVRAAAERYDAFLFLDLSVPTTVAAIDAVAERALLVPMLDDEPVVRLPIVAAAVTRARLILCTTDAEAALVAQIFGPPARVKTRVIGMGVDMVPAAELRADRIERLTHGRSFVLVAGEDVQAIASMRAGGERIIALDDTPERDRAAFFAFARAVAIVGEGVGFVPEAAEAWAYGKPVLVAENAPAAALLVREAGGGIVVPEGGWRAAFDALADTARFNALARQGAAYVEGWGGWRRVAARASHAISDIAALDDGRSREALLAQVGYLYPLVQRQRRIIAAMRASRFWRLRDAWFAGRRRFGLGPLDDPIPELAAGDRAFELAALGDPYQLFLQQRRLRADDIERIRAMTAFLPRAVSLSVVIDIRCERAEGVVATLRSLNEQLYPHWHARVLVDGDGPQTLAGYAANDERIALVRAGEERFGAGDYCGALDAGDLLEPHALFEFALALQDPDVDIVYCDEDRLDDRNVAVDPWFKPDWSPETLLTRDYVGRLCLIRRSLLEAVGGVRDVFESARWYEALLRVSEHTDRIEHIAAVLCHRDSRNTADLSAVALAAETALQRRGENATVAAAPLGLDVRFTVRDEPRVSIIIPTRDRADLLRPCIESLFEITAYGAFDVIVIDNGSRDPATLALLDAWSAREPERFQVRRDPSPFNYSRLNNEAVRSTGAPYIVLLNNDTQVLAPEWLEAMLGQAQRPEIGAVGGLLLYGDGSVQHAGIVLGILGLAGHAHRFLPGTAPGYHGALQLDTNYLAVTGACLMVAKHKYEEVGGLDDSMAVSYNDVDLCLKLHRAGYRNVFVPRARLYHYESKSRGADDSPAKVARAIEEVEIIRRRWPGWAVRDPYYNPNLTVDAEDFGLRL